MKELDFFVAALEKQEPSERAAYLNEVCGSDKDLRARVNRLLELHQTAGNFLQMPAFEWNGAADATLGRPAGASDARSAPEQGEGRVCFC